MCIPFARSSLTAQSPGRIAEGTWYTPVMVKGVFWTNCLFRG